MYVYSTSSKNDSNIAKLSSYCWANSNCRILIFYWLTGTVFFSLCWAYKAVYVLNVSVSPWWYSKLLYKVLYYVAEFRVWRIFNVGCTSQACQELRRYQVSNSGLFILHTVPLKCKYFLRQKVKVFVLFFTSCKPGRKAKFDQWNGFEFVLQEN